MTALALVERVDGGPNLPDDARMPLDLAPRHRTASPLAMRGKVWEVEAPPVSHSATASPC
jgi:hypothetical protein